MAGSGAVIAQCLCSVAAKKYGPGVFDHPKNVLGVFHRNLKVLRSNEVAGPGSCGKVIRENQQPAVAQRSLDYLAALHLWKQFIDAALDLLQKFSVCRYQYRLRLLIMLRLRKKIHGNPVRIGFSIADHG